MNEYSPTGTAQGAEATSASLRNSDGAAQSDPLTRLEQRWEKLAKGIQDLRNENAALWEQLQGREDQLTSVELQLATKIQELATKAEEMVAINAEKEQTNARIDVLIARFDEIGQ